MFRSQTSVNVTTQSWPFSGDKPQPLASEIIDGLGRHLRHFETITGSSWPRRMSLSEGDYLNIFTHLVTIVYISSLPRAPLQVPWRRSQWCAQSRCSAQPQCSTQFLRRTSPRSSRTARSSGGSSPASRTPARAMASAGFWQVICLFSINNL